MLYGLLADLVVVAHLAWILFLILGALPGYRWAWVKWLHLASLAFSVTLQTFGWICPITHLEVWLRHRAEPGGGYAGTFIRHYVERLVYVPITPAWIFAGTLVVIGITLWVYFGPRRRG
jgi:hypothetical protein